MRGNHLVPWFLTLLFTVAVLIVSRLVWTVSAGLFRRAVYAWYGEKPE